MIGKKGALPLIAIVAIICAVIIIVEGIILVNFIYFSESVARALREAAIIKAINKVEFVKRSLSKALDFSFYQSSYDISKRGGFFQANCLPYWRNYSTTYYPDLRNSLKSRIKEVLNEYVDKLNNDVYVPSYDRVEFETKAFQNIEDAIACSYYRCTKGCDSNEVKNIPGCLDFCISGETICNLGAETFPVEFVGTQTVHKANLESRIGLDCLFPTGPTFTLSFSTLISYISSVAKLAIELLFGLGKADINFVIIDRIAITDHRNEEKCMMLDTYKDLEVRGDVLQIYTYKQTSEFGICPLCLSLTVYGTYLKLTPSIFINVKASSSEELKLDIEGIKVTDNPNMERRYTTNINELFYTGKQRFVDDDKVLNIINFATTNMPDNYKQIEVGNVLESMLDPNQVLQDNHPDWESKLKQNITDELKKLEFTNHIKLKIDVSEMVVENDGSCTYESIEIRYKTCTNEAGTYDCGYSASPCCENPTSTETANLYKNVKCTYDYYAAAKVLIKIIDNTVEYPVYDYDEETTGLRKIPLTFYVLSGNRELIETPINLCHF